MHRYPRSARVNELVREVLADELERVGDPRLELVTVTGVDVSPDLKSAKVFYSALESDEDLGSALDPADRTGETEDAAGGVANALEDARRQLQSALGRQVRLKYVPRLVFVEDPAIREGERIESIIRRMHPDEEDPT